MRLLAETEGVFAETAGGVTLAAAQKLRRAGRIGERESVVVCVTGNGLKTLDPLVPELPSPRVIGPSLKEFDALAKGS
jgi:threonine synthase